MCKQCKWVDEVLPHAPWIITEGNFMRYYRVFKQNENRLCLPRWHSLCDSWHWRCVCVMQKVGQIQSHQENGRNFNNRRSCQNPQKQINVLHPKSQERSTSKPIRTLSDSIHIPEHKTFTVSSKISW